MTQTSLLKQQIRWWPALAIGAIGATVFGAIQFREFAFTGRPSVDAMWTVVATEVGLFVWLMAWSRIHPVNCVRILFAAMTFSIGICLVICVQGFTGDGRPIFAWRCSPGIETLLSAHREKAATALASSGISLVTRPEDSSQFRGPNRTGAVRGVRLKRDWSESPPQLLWRHPVGEGWSSFAVAGSYCLTQEQRGPYETVVCYEVETGRECWEHRSLAEFQELMGGRGPRATPTIHDGRVYALGSTGILSCLDGVDGHAVWSRNVLEDGGCANRPFGMVGSPLIVGDVVVVSPGCPGGSLAAYDRETGNRRWGAGDAPAAYSSPVFAEIAGREQILTFNAEGLFAHDWRDGTILWSYPWVTPPELNNVCQPVALPDANGNAASEVFLSSGYDKGCAVLTIRDVDDQFAAVPAWKNRNLRAKFSSVVIRDGFAYGLDERILTCVDLRNGDRRWKAGRYGFGQLLLVDDLLLIQAETGNVALVEATPERYRELARFTALESRTWNHPVLAGQLLLVRNDRESACYRLPVDD